MGWVGEGACSTVIYLGNLLMIPPSKAPLLLSIWLRNAPIVHVITNIMSQSSGWE